ncbi:MAG: hypothetical protein IPN01_21225 [Deltaproteobacteria bacterium]|nr:hypothetical protein [Deltaproteobacteria bacterium]
MLNGWRLNTADNDLEASTARSRAIVIESSEWKDMIDALEPVLRRRGVLVQRTGVAAVGLEALQAHARAAGPSDRLFCYLAGHGSNHRDTVRDELGPAALHYVLFDNGILSVSQLGPIFHQIAEQGCDLSVLDGSCNGGETVLNATGERYLCMATTGVYSPGGTGFPAMAEWLSLDPPQAGFGLWPEEPRLMASWLNGAIVRGNPWRFHQRLLRNDRGPLSSRLVYFRTAVDLLKILDMGGWNFMMEKCYLYAHIYPDAFNALSAAEQATYTNDTASYIAAMTFHREAARPFINELRALLSDNTRIAAAAAVYHAGFTAAWRTLAGDASWDPGANPTAKVSDLQGLSPGGYKGTAGFHRLVQDFLIDLAAMEECYRIQLSLLTQIDAALARDALAKHITLPVLRPVEVMPRSAGDIDHYQEYNRYVERSRVSAPAVHRTVRLPIPRTQGHGFESGCERDRR